MRKGSTQGGRPIGDPVAPPRKRERKIRYTYYCGLSNKGIFNRIIKRMLWLIPLIIALSFVISLLILFPVMIMGFISKPINWIYVTSPLIFVFGFIILFITVAPIGILIGYKQITSSKSSNHIDVTDDKLIINIRISNMVSPRKFEIPFDNIKDVIEPDEVYFNTRKNEGSYFHYLANYIFKPRIGDYFSMYSQFDDLLIILLREPMFAPYFDYKWTASEIYNKGKRINEIVVDVDRGKHVEFMSMVKKRSKF